MNGGCYGATGRDERKEKRETGTVAAMSAVADGLAGLGAWYTERGRHALPWRRTRDAWAVFVSEVMLQQTQVDRVRPYWERWMARWPTVAELAAAPAAEAIREWAGLGYNRRALHLHRAAQAVVERHGGRSPVEERAIRELPGAGEYTAAAVACFAGGARTVVADTNIARVLARAALGVASQREASAAAVRAAGEALLPHEGARDHNLALMDLGAMVCTPRAPECDGCPLVAACAWRAAGYPAAVMAPKTAARFETTARFARGRIIDALRAGPRPEHELRESLPAAHAVKLHDYLAALAKEGLVMRAGDGWALPH